MCEQRGIFVALKSLKDVSFVTAKVFSVALNKNALFEFSDGVFYYFLKSHNT